MRQSFLVLGFTKNGMYWPVELTASASGRRSAGWIEPRGRGEGTSVHDFKLVVRQDGDLVDVAVTGELDAVTSAQLRQTLLGFAGVGAKTVTVDLSGVASVDSTTLGVLVGGAKRLRRRHGDLVLKAPTWQTRHSRTAPTGPVRPISRRRNRRVLLIRWRQRSPLAGIVATLALRVRRAPGDTFHPSSAVGKRVLCPKLIPKPISRCPMRPTRSPPSCGAARALTTCLPTPTPRVQTPSPRRDVHPVASRPRRRATLRGAPASSVARLNPDGACTSLGGT